jgi:hypothetical protein
LTAPTIADVLPSEGEVGAHLVYGWVVSWVIERAQSPSGFLTEARIGAEKRLHQLTSFILELAQPFVHRLHQAQGQEVNADLEGQAHVVQEMTDVAIEGADGLQLRRVEQSLRHPDQCLVGIDFNPGRADLATVAQQAEMKFDEDRLLGKLIVRALNVQDWRCCCHFILLLVVGTLKLLIPHFDFQLDLRIFGCSSASMFIRVRTR